MNAVAKHEPEIQTAAELQRIDQPSRAVTPMDMIGAAIERGAGLDVVEKLMGLHERWEANQGRKAFDAAIATAKGEIPPITKDRAVDFSTSKGRTNYRYESLAEIARVVDPILHRHGLSYRFRSKQDGQRLTVSCILSHRDGCSEETTLSAAEDHSGNKNTIQAIGSAATYLMRYSLKMALGLSVTDDDDGRGYGAQPAAPASDVITDEQAERIRDLAQEVGADVPRFLAFLRVPSISDIPAGRFDDAVVCLEKKRARQ
jgi:hypothetical protein